MRLLLQAAVFLTATARSLVIPPIHAPSHEFVDGHAVAGSAATDATSVFFSIPCQGCFTDPKDELDLELKIDPSIHPCQPSALSLNGARISSSPSDILFKANSTSGSQVKVVLADVNSTCLDSRVTLLSFRIKEIIGQANLPNNIGFSTSLKQSPSSSSILRLEYSPLIDSIDDSIKQKWTQAQEYKDFVVVEPTRLTQNDLPDEFQKELRKLHEIKARIGRLLHAHMRQEHRIYQMIKDDFDVCKGATCYFQTAIKKAPEIFELLKAHFKHRPDFSKLHKFRDFQHQQEIPLTMDNDVARHGIHKQGDAAITYEGMPDEELKQDIHDEVSSDDLPFPPPPTHEGHHHPPSPPQQGDEDCLLPPTHLPEHHSGHLPPPPPPGPHKGCPPPPPWRHHGRPGHRPPGHPHSGLHTNSHRPWRHGHRSGPHRHPIFFSLGTIAFFVVVASLLFKCVRARTGLFHSHKRQRDRAARREECRNRAAYRRAAMRHKWKQWWSQFRRPESTADYEEKRARLLGQEDALEDVMQSEIRELRRAHEIVGDMMRAEEGRQRLYHEANFGSSSSSSPNSHTIQRQNTESSETTETSLPLYQPPPPSYDQELEGEMMVVDGFSYTPSASESTPDSSVVDCHSEMSFESSTIVTK